MLFGEIAILTVGGVLGVSDVLDMFDVFGVLVPSPPPQLLSTPIAREAVKNSGGFAYVPLDAAD
jgi:hypothetical protein